MSKKKKIRTTGEILLDLELLMNELVYDQGLQTGDILSLVYSHLQVHCPSAFEVYTEDGTSPTFYYGHLSGLRISTKLENDKT